MSSFFRGDYVSSKEASEKLGVHFQTLRNWDREGKIKTIRSPGGKRFYDVKVFQKKQINKRKQKMKKMKKVKEKKYAIVV